jgi:hypothetical protein
MSILLADTDTMSIPRYGDTSIDTLGMDAKPGRGYFLIRKEA